MKHPLTCALLAVAAAGLSACPSNTERPASPTILSFTADAQQISRGGTVHLSFTAKDADAVTLTDQAGNVIPLDGTAHKGEASVQPEATTFYVLRAKSEGGSTAAALQVAVDEPLAEVSLVAVPPLIDSGQTAQLLWSAPHAQSAQLKVGAGEALPVNAKGGSGVIDVQPQRTQQYTFVAQGAPGEEGTASAKLRVRPLVDAFFVLPGAAKPGETLLFTWKTRGAASVVLSEYSFGELYRADAGSDTVSVDEGSFAWELPSELPWGQEVLLGHPLHFTLQVIQNDPAVALTRVIDTYVGDGPAIDFFDAPPAITEGKPLVLSWRTRNAARVQLLRDGQTVFEDDALKVEAGSFSAGALEDPATFTLRAFSFGGAMTETSQQVRPVPAAQVTSFSLNSPIAQPGDAMEVSWTTQKATAVYIRLRNGPTVFVTHDAARVASGSTTLRPGNTAEYVLEAYNDAADAATMSATAEVGGATTLVLGPTPLALGETTTATWTLPQALTAEVQGDPRAPPEKTNPGTSWLELSAEPAATVLQVPDADDAVVAVKPLLPFRFPFMGRVVEQFFVSTNGFIAFDAAAPMPENNALNDAAVTLPSMLAPFWDDLHLGKGGQLLSFVEDTAFPRRLVVEWKDVQTADGSTVTFQAQLFEDGRFVFAYQALSGFTSRGELASIGWRFDGTHAKELATGGPVVSAKDELGWFGASTAVGSLTFAPVRPGAFTLFGRTAAMDRVIYSAPVNVIDPAALVLNEAMVSPPASVAAGKWLELHNRSKEEVDLSFAQLQCKTAGLTFLLPEGTRIPAGGYLVVGQSQDAAQNGGAPVDVEWPGFDPQPASPDELSLSAVSTLAVLPYQGGEVTQGASLNSAEASIDANGDPLTCKRTQAYGTGGIGTPGARNEPCFDYLLSPIPVAFDDISGSGTPLFAQGQSQDSVVAQVSLAEAPFPFFGAAQSTVWVSSNGFLTFSPPADSGTFNKAVPAFSEPSGTVAPLWDDLSGRLPASNVFVKRRADHWVIHWNDYERWLRNDQLDFEVKLFDSGEVEFHYGDIKPGTLPFEAWANSATAWLEAPGGASALPISINAPGLQPHSAWRFTHK